MRPIYSYLAGLLLILATAACSDDDLIFYGPSTYGSGPEIVFDVEIEDMEGGTRGLLEESKQSFATGELIHVRAVYDCELDGVKSTKVQYGVLKYAGHGKWNAFDASHKLVWPDDAITGTFTAYYINGSNGVLTSNAMPEKLLSSYKYDQIPLFCEVKDAGYGYAIKLPMRRIFSYLTLTEMQEGISEQLWFTIPSDPETGLTTLNNAFRLNFDPETFEMTQDFVQVPNTDYKNSHGQPLVYIESHITELEVNGEVTSATSFILQPGVIHKFNILYPRGHDTYATYLTYQRDLEKLTGPEGLKPNGRYIFSILKSLGVVVEQTPDDGWDDDDPVIIIDVEKFLRAVNSGTDYYETDLNTGEDVQVLQSTPEGSRMVRNVDFQYKYYDIFTDDAGNIFRPNQNLTFDGNYHYIYHMGCPLFYQNDGNIVNLGIRDASTAARPILSTEALPVGSGTADVSYNGIITSRNNGNVENVRVSNVEMTVQVETTDPDEPTQEAHNVALLFGVNRGNVYDITLAGNLNLTVENAPGVTVVPRVTIGTVAGQNLGNVSGITTIDDDGFDSPVISITNRLKGDNGAYKVGGIAGSNTGWLDDIFLPQLTIDATSSAGVESYLGGLVGDMPSSNSGAPSISGCIVRGEVRAGKVAPITNLYSLSYVGGIAGSFNVQGSVLNSSVSVGVVGSHTFNKDVEYAEGGAFGALTRSVGTIEGTIQTVACYANVLEGFGYKGNFAGVVPAGFGWDHYADSQINIRKLTENNVGYERE